MNEARVILVLIVAAFALHAQPAPRPTFNAFEVATIKPAEPGEGRFIRMQSAHRFFVRNYPLKRLVAAAYNVTLAQISGGPAWIESDRYDILAGTPGDVQPNTDEQMSMLRKLLTDRFSLTFHRDQKEFAIYKLTVAKSGSRLKESIAPAGTLPQLISTVYPDHILMPARNATMEQFASIMQVAIVDRPVVNETDLSGRYDFDLKWAPDETQFGGELARAVKPDEALPGLFAALQSELGLKLESARGTVDVIVIDRIERPTPN
jgi:uncharacterized protein (TIGR03435 family)